MKQALRVLRKATYSCPSLSNVAFFRNRLIRLNKFKGTIRTVSLCQHRHLCTGVELEVEWDDGLTTFICSQDVEEDAKGRLKLVQSHGGLF
jgi:hypothetical protein